MSRKDKTVFAIGLPRCGGQSLQLALASARPGVGCYHSLHRETWSDMKEGESAVEVFSPIECLEKEFDAPLYIVNERDIDSWFESCKKVYHLARNWSHPLWKYPLNHFKAYYHQYHLSILDVPSDRVLFWDITKKPVWDELCEFLEVPIPSVPFPNKDFTRNYFKRKEAIDQLASMANHLLPHPTNTQQY